MAAVEGRLDEELFVLMIMGDDRSVRATYVRGESAKPLERQRPRPTTKIARSG